MLMALIIIPRKRNVEKSTGNLFQAGQGESALLDVQLHGLFQQRVFSPVARNPTCVEF